MRRVVKWIVGLGVGVLLLDLMATITVILIWKFW